MTTYRAVVKYPLDASNVGKAQVLKLGIAECALELYEIGLTVGDIETCFEEALGEVEHEDARVAEA
jgi:hypothetical protein